MLVEEGRDVLSPFASNRIQVLLIHPCPIVRAGLRLLLENQPQVAVTGEAQNCSEAVRIASQAHPDIILLDATFDGESCLDQLPTLRAAASGARLLLLLGIDDLELQQQAVRLGVMGIIRKDQPVTVLYRAIEKVHAGEVWIDRAMMANVLTNLSRGRAVKETEPEAAKIAALTEREREVIRLVGAGLKNKDIADRLYISETTVRHHLTSIFSKLGVADRLELVIYAYHHGLAKPPSTPPLRG